MIDLNINNISNDWISTNSNIKLKNDNDNLVLVSNLPDGSKASYIHYKVNSRLDSVNGAQIKIDKGGSYTVSFKGRVVEGKACSLYIIGYTDKERIETHTVYMNSSNTINISDNVKYLKLAIRVPGKGIVSIENISIIKYDNIDEYIEYLAPKNIISKNTNDKYLVLTNIYANENDLYRNGFVHRRVKAYQNVGLDVEVFAFQGNSALTSYNFDGVKVYNGNRKSLEEFLKCTDYKKILIHFINEDMYNGIKNVKPNTPLIIWIHAIETESWTRRIFNASNDEEVEELINRHKNNYKRRNFIRSIVNQENYDTKIIFISEFIKNICMEDIDYKINDEKYYVINNLTDENLFKFNKKNVNQRKKVLSIRPFVTKKYGNDLTINAILELSKRKCFDDLEFDIYGKGPLFDELVEPLRKYKNVKLHEEFLNQKEIANLHKEYGIFLCPTRWDTQGVSMCEAMASGMVVVTNGITAIPEFANKEVAMLSDEEDYIGLADSIEELYYDSKKFSKLSKLASKFIVEKTGTDKVIKEEIKVILSK